MLLKTKVGKLYMPNTFTLVCEVYFLSSLSAWSTGLYIKEVIGLSFSLLTQQCPVIQAPPA